jgi:hypothetical protein
MKKLLIALAVIALSTSAHAVTKSPARALVLKAQQICAPQKDDIVVYDACMYRVRTTGK